MVNMSYIIMTFQEDKTAIRGRKEANYVDYNYLKLPVKLVFDSAHPPHICKAL